MRRTSYLQTFIISIAVGLIFCQLAAAQTNYFIVTTTNDDGSAGSLRAMIVRVNTNTNPGPNEIDFQIPGTGPFTISIGAGLTNSFTPLPAITNEVVIDGYTQTGATRNTLSNGDNAALMIELDGTFGGSDSVGLELRAGSCTVRGLAINRFEGPGILLRGGGGNRIEGNFIGPDIPGTSSMANQGGGILVMSSSNVIGGATAEKRNLISGNLSSGIAITNAVGNQVQGNLIGSDITGTNALANGRDGVLIDAVNNTIGGVTSGAANLIAFNQGHGVLITNGTGNALLGNSIFANGLLGISLGGGTGTTNDPGDADSGPNNFQNYPLIDSAVSSGGIRISGTLNSIANSSFRIEFFATTTNTCTGEGQRFLGGLTNVLTDDSGNALFSANLPVAVQTGEVVTATATYLDSGDTSEFSPCQIVTAPPVITTQPQSRTNTVGTTATFIVTVSGTTPFGYQWQFNTTNLSGAVGPVLSLTNVQVSDAGNYLVVVSNIAGSATSQVATLTVLVPPAITSQPQSLTNLAGTTAAFAVTATGTPPLSYQWRFNGANIGGATGATLSLTNVQVSNAGNYLVVVTNLSGSTTSVVATLAVSPVLLGSWPTNLVQCCGFTKTLELYTVLKDSFTITNQSSTKVPSTVVKFFFSTNSIFDPGDLLIGKTMCLALKPHTSRTLRFRGNLPPGMVAAGNYLFAVVDATHRVSTTENIVPFGLIP